MSSEDGSKQGCRVTRNALPVRTANHDRPTAQLLTFNRSLAIYWEAYLLVRDDDNGVGWVGTWKSRGDKKEEVLLLLALQYLGKLG